MIDHCPFLLSRDRLT